MTLSLKLLLTFYVFTLIVLCDGFQVTLYSSTRQTGNWKTIDVDNCVNLNHYDLCQTGFVLYNPFSAITCELACCLRMVAADNVESINTHGNCVRVYRNYDCADMVGPKIEPGSDCHSNWGDRECGFKNDIRSISPCDGQCINPADRLRRRSNDRCELHQLRDGRPIFVTFDNVGGLKVPKFLETYLFRTFDSRTQFQGSYWARRFSSMHGRAGIDARGHLLASSLGGEAQDWNFAPQKTEINNGDGTGQGWKSLELKIKNHLLKDSCTHVYWQQDVHYSTEPRPETFTIVAHFYETRCKQLTEVGMVTLECYNDLDNPINGFCQTSSDPNYPN